MSVTFAAPVFTGSTPEEQLKSMQSWLYQFSEQLQYTLNNLDSSNFSSGVIKEITNAKYDSKSSSTVGDEVDVLKSLIIKTANTVKSRYDEITETLNSEYLATSDFGDYSENSKATIIKTALGVTQNYEKIVEIEKNLDTVDVSFNTYVNKTNAYIRTGYLEQLDAYGVAIGEEITETIDGNEAVIFNHFATLTAKELAFWQNGVKVGYFQGDSLYVNGDIRIGDWAISQVSGFTIKYVG